MFYGDVAGERQTESETILLSRRDERLKQPIVNCAWYSWTIVFYLDLHEIASFHRLNPDSAPARHRLQRVRDHIEKDAFHPGAL